MSGGGGGGSSSARMRWRAPEKSSSRNMAVFWGGAAALGLLPFFFFSAFSSSSCKTLQLSSFPLLRLLPRSHHPPAPGVPAGQIATLNCKDLGMNEESQRLYYKPRADFVNASCRSKYEHPCYWKNLPQMPQSFISTLEEYELYHYKCTRDLNLTDLATAGDVAEGCKYLVWKARDGMGNQLLSLVSAYVYSLLTHRVMLIATDSHIQNHLCNPFSFSSWVLPTGFPEPQLRMSAKRMANYIAEVIHEKQHATQYNISRITPKHLQVYIICCDNARDHPFFCPAAQYLLSSINWIFYDSHEHTLPAFHLIPEFRRKLHRWFPNHDAFTHVARYLLHPQDNIWEHISQFYRSHMDGAPKMLGIQVRAWSGDYQPPVSRQVARCVAEQMLLSESLQDKKTKIAEAFTPEVDTQKEQPDISKPMQQDASNETAEPWKATTMQKKKTDISVLVASLRPEYRNDLASLYKKNDSANESSLLRVNVVSASAEGQQKTGNAEHDETAIADIWLLSFTHDMVVTPLSTFGSVASGLAGIMPLILIYYGQDMVEEAACMRNNVAGPCFHTYPRNQACELDPPSFAIKDPAAMVPEVKYCLHETGGIGVVSSFYIP